MKIMRKVSHVSQVVSIDGESMPNSCSSNAKMSPPFGCLMFTNSLVSHNNNTYENTRSKCRVFTDHFNYYLNTFSDLCRTK